MTPDLAEIRQALAAATPGPWSQHVLNFVETGDCPSCEIDYSAAVGFIVVRPHLSDDGADGVNDAHLVANAPTWLAALCDEVERLRAENDKDTDRIAVLVWDRDAALARIAELDESIADFQQLAVDRTAERDAALADNAVWVATVNESAAQRKAWRACADQLAACLDPGDSDDADEALAEYERLRS